MSIRTFLVLGMLLLVGPARAMELRFAAGEHLSFDFSAEVSSESASPPLAQGPFADVVRAVCTHIRVDCRIDLVPWRRALAMIEQGLSDAIFAVIPGYEKAADFLFSPVLVDSPLELYTHSSNPARSWPQEQAERERRPVLHTLGPSGTANLVVQRLQGMGPVHVHLEDNNLRLMRKLDAGRFGDGMVVMNRDIARRLIERYELRNIRLVGPFETVGYAIAFSRTRASSEKFQAFQRGLGELIADGTIAGIFRRYRLELAASPHD